MITYTFKCGFVSEKNLNDTVSSVVFYLKDVGKCEGLGMNVSSPENADGFTTYIGRIILNCSPSEKDFSIIKEIAEDNNGYIEFNTFEK